MRFLVALVASLAFASAATHHHDKREISSVIAPTDKELESMFSSFVKSYNKKYTHDDFFNRFATFKQNVETIRLHNTNSNASYKLGVNEFADMTWEEFRANKLGYKNVDLSLLRSKNTVELSTEDVPDTVDWRNTANVVSGVKDQGQCGSCWAFSTTGSVEGAWGLSKKASVSLSEQQLVDCSTSAGNEGCNGGLMDYAFQWIISNKGITSEASYPYTGVDGTCKTGKAVAATISKFTDVGTNMAQLQAAAALQPVSVAIEADQSAFQLYSSGVLTGTCGTNLDHGVLVVGYGHDSSANKDYWTVKNSWGASWGEKGYVRILRDSSDKCGIYLAASYPTV